jgi:16S rRNA (guanine1516-N2)-methyltransferase
MNFNVLDLDTADHIQKLHSNNQCVTVYDKTKHLYYSEGILKLCSDSKSFHIDFNSSDILNRINPRLKKCSVIQAVEGNKKGVLEILDATAGLGRDMFTLASRGHNVTAIEQDIYIYLLLTDALLRARELTSLQHIANNINLINGNSSAYIHKTDNTFDCIYLDPMFPTRRKSAKVKQNMQLLHTIVINDEDTNKSLFDSAIHSKKAKKVIVKRPAKAELLSDKKPSSQLIGKANRFDIYSL